MARILLKATIPYSADDWHIGRFAMLREHLVRLGHQVTARDRVPDANGDDVDLLGLGTAPVDQLWLFAVDCHAGLTAADGDGIARFRARGGGVLATRDHQDLGACLLRLGELGAAHHFHEVNCEREADRRCRDDLDTADVTWPNYHSGANGDVQSITALVADHPLLRDGERPSTPSPRIRTRGPSASRPAVALASSPPASAR